MSKKTIQGQTVVFVIIIIVMAAVAATIYFKDVRDAIHQTHAKQPASSEPIRRIP